MKVTVIGQGYVGLTVAIGAAKSNHQVIGFDINNELITELSRGESFVPGVKKTELIELIRSGNYRPSGKVGDIQHSEIVVIAVPTPLTAERKPDLQFVNSAIKIIAENINNSALIINESTSYPGTLRNFIKPTLEQLSKEKYMFAAAPERVDPGNSEWTLINTPRVIAGLNDEATINAIDFYSTFCEKIYRAPNSEVAEASKIFENTFRQINIALVNEFSEISEKLGFSASDAIKAASTKPFGFMPFYPSIGVGGHCIPIDPSYLSYISEKFGIRANFIELANETNLKMPQKVAEKIQRHFGGSIKSKRIQIAGVAYKPNVEDMRESPALRLIEELQALGAEVIWHDPLVRLHKGQKSVPLDPSVDLGLIVTPHNEIDFLIWQKAGTKVLDVSANITDFGWPKFL